MKRNFEIISLSGYLRLKKSDLYGRLSDENYIVLLWHLLLGTFVLKLLDLDVFIRILPNLSKKIIGGYTDL